MQEQSLLVEKADILTRRPCPLGPKGDHSDEARSRRRRVGAFRTKVMGGLDVGARLGEECFFLSLSVRYDVGVDQADQVYSLSDLTLYFEAFVRKLRRLGLVVKYCRVAEATERGVVNHFHSILRCSQIPSALRKKTRFGRGLDFYKLREVWKDASGGSQGVYVKPIVMRSRGERVSAVGYLSKYLTKQYEGGVMYWSTSRDWLPRGSRAEYDRLFSILAVRYMADCGLWHTDASMVYGPWLRFLIRESLDCVVTRSVVRSRELGVFERRV